MLQKLPIDVQRNVLARLAATDRVNVSLVNKDLARVDREDTAAWNLLVARDFPARDGRTTTKQGKTSYEHHALCARIDALEFERADTQDALRRAETDVVHVQHLPRAAAYRRIVDTLEPAVAVAPRWMLDAGFGAYQYGKGIGAACHPRGQSGVVGLALGGVLGVAGAVVGLTAGVAAAAGRTLAESRHLPLGIRKTVRRARVVRAETQREHAAIQQAHDSVVSALERCRSLLARGERDVPSVAA